MRTKTRGNGQGTAYKRGNVWEACIVIGWRPPTKEGGNPIPIKRRKSGFPTKKAALAYCQDLYDDTGTRKNPPRLISYWESYRRNEFAKLSKSKQTAYNIAWNKLKPLHPVRVDKITVDDLRKAVSDACPTYYPAKDCKTVLTTLFSLAAAEGHVNKDLPSFIILPPLKEKEREIFTEEEQTALWKAYESGNRDAAIALLMIYTGMMPGEAQQLKVEHIDLENRVITRVGLKTEVRKSSPILIAQSIVPLVQDLIDHAMPSGYIWYHNEDEWYKQYYAGLEAAHCRRLAPYSCRHTTATALAITENIAPQTIKKVMRWSTSKMLDRYAHPDTEDALSAVDTLSKPAKNPVPTTHILPT